MTQKERERFASYLELKADTSKKMIVQMKKAGMPEAIMEREKKTIFASLFIAGDLRSAESMMIGADHE